MLLSFVAKFTCVGSFTIAFGTAKLKGKLAREAVVMDDIVCF